MFFSLCFTRFICSIAYAPDTLYVPDRTGFIEVKSIRIAYSFQKIICSIAVSVGNNSAWFTTGLYDTIGWSAAMIRKKPIFEQ